MFSMAVPASALALVMPVLLHGQAGTAPSDTTRTARTMVYAEGWGVSSIASANGERTLWIHDRLHLSMRIGVGTIQLKDFTRRFNPDLVFPVGAYGSYGGRIAAEFGAGAAFTSVVHPDVDTFAPQRDQRVHGWLSAGVRTRGTRRGLFARAAFNLLFEFGRVSRTAGLGLGYRF